jgi:hypothetical protein
MLTLGNCDNYITTEKRSISILWSFGNIVYSSVALYILNNNLNKFDFFYFSLCILISFIIILLMIYPNCSVLTIIHILIPLALFFTPMAKNVYLILLSIITIIIMFITWYIYGKCIMFKEDETWNMDIPQDVTAAIWLIILSYKLYKKIQ